MAKTAVAFAKAVRVDGVEAHNLEWMEDESHINLRISKTVPPTPSKNGKPLASTSRGFITIGEKGEYALSLNMMDRRK